MARVCSASRSIEIDIFLFEKKLALFDHGVCIHLRSVSLLGVYACFLHLCRKKRDQVQQFVPSFTEDNQEWVWNSLSKLLGDL